jgi:hypothetical protein
MAIDVMALLNQLEEDNEIGALANDPRVQFGPPNRPLLGATLLPDRTVEANSYTEESIRFMTVIANDGARHAPAQRKGSGVAVADISVVLGDQDIQRLFTSKDYEVFQRLLNRDASQEAILSILGWVDKALVRPLEQLKEKHRWDAMVNAQVVRRGHNGMVQTVTYPDPAGHRATVGDPWDDPLIDPFDDIAAQAQLLRDAGFAPTRIITSSNVVSVMSANPLVRSRVGQALFQVDENGALSARYLRANINSINASLQGDNLPVIEVYDETYKTQTETKFYLPRDTMVILGTTELDESIRIPAETPGAEEVRFLENTLGYTAIGVPVGESEPGRVVRLFPQKNKPPRIIGEAWQTTIPVIQEGAAIATLDGIYT